MVTTEGHNSFEYRKFVKDNFSLKRQLEHINRIMDESFEDEVVSRKEDSGKNMEYELQRGEEFFAAGRFREAENSFLTVIGKDPENHEAYNNLGVVSYEKGDYEAATRFFVESLRRER